MIEILRHLKGEFIVLDLGSAHTAGVLKKIPGLTEAITLVEVDPLLKDPTITPNRICLNKAVAGRRSRRVFKQRKFPDCSSFLEPNAELIKAYGLEDFFVEVGSLEIECETISVLLAEQGISRVDFFKTDLEGMDFEVLTSAPELIRQALCVQAEVRFQPFYAGEAYFHQIASYLTEAGFELISLRSQNWKYATPGRDLERDGRTVWADAVFFLSGRCIRERFGTEIWKAFVKQILLARLLGLSNFAEWIYEKSKSEVPIQFRSELAALVKPPSGFLRSATSLINGLPLGWAILEVLRRTSRTIHSAASIYRHRHAGETFW